MKLMRRFGVGVAAVIVGLAMFAPGAGAQEELWRSFRGRVVCTDVALAPEASFQNPAMMSAALQRIARSGIDQRDGFWRIHVLAFLDRPSPSGALLLRATDVSTPTAPRPVRVFDVPVERGTKEVRLDDFVVTPAMGFMAGASYELSFEAPPEEGNAGAETRKAGKADVYAKGVITLR
jgi:hypothetical protein